MDRFSFDRMLHRTTYSPHAWGWTTTGNGVRVVINVFPTRVGMDLEIREDTHKPHRIPHTRGDGP